MQDSLFCLQKYTNGLGCLLEIPAHVFAITNNAKRLFS
jgi:hypothetical protein